LEEQVAPRRAAGHHAPPVAEPRQGPQHQAGQQAAQEGDEGDRQRFGQHLRHRHVRAHQRHGRGELRVGQDWRRGGQSASPSRRKGDISASAFHLAPHRRPLARQEVAHRAPEPGCSIQCAE
jgi:hypothetical protein